MQNRDKTYLGYIAVILWGTAGAFIRSISEEVGAFNAGFYIYILGGLMTMFLTPKIRKKPVAATNELKPTLICGFFYVMYVLTTIYSIAISKTRLINLRVGAVHSLWPLFTLILSILLLGEKKKLSIFGLLFSFAGILVVVLGGSGQDVIGSFSGGITDLLPFIIGFLSAVCWAFYSNLVKKYNIEDNRITGLFMLISGLLMGLFSLFMIEPSDWSVSVIYQITYRVVVTLFLATYLWNQSMLKGDIYKVVMAANFQPMISALLFALILGVNLNISILAGGALLVIGNFLQNSTGKKKIILEQ